MAPLRPFPLTVSSLFIPKLSLVHWQTQHPSHPAPPLQTVESFVNATSPGPSGLQTLHNKGADDASGPRRK
ncbi:hypothetical protein BC826DRAFT_1066831 [Russula brevipes]|nr:hypothetical protein BC826DRAFT_1066831 [Russula brevipes]